MSALKDLLLRQISKTGPMTLADYMSACLLHPDLGYYTTRDPLGQAGDFITAPEISQMFGEIIGLALAQSWMDRGRPAPFALVELGPGRGTLMADIMRVTRAVPGFTEAAELHLIEASPTLKAAQARHFPDATWHDSINTLPDMPLFLVANEFFDALPIRQFLRDGDQWRELVVGGKEETLVPGWSEKAPQGDLAHRLQDTDDKAIVETCAPACVIAADLGARIARQGGVALIIDYGDWRSRGDTFQALHAHKPVNPFATPGQADLTAHVDFEALAKAAAPGAVSKMTPQGVFLERLGITARAQTLANQLTGEALETHISAHRRLTHPQEMGSLFKVMAVFAEGTPPPPGVDT